MQLTEKCLTLTKRNETIKLTDEAKIREGRYRCRAFSCEGVRLNLVRGYADDDDVLVWDSVAGHFTRLHCLSDKDVRRLRAKLFHPGNPGYIVREGFAS